MQDLINIQRLLEQHFENVAQQIASIKQTPATPEFSEFLTPTQTSQLTGFTLRALEAMRAKRTGPAFIKLGAARNGPIRYRLNDVRTWMQAHQEVTDAAR